MKQKAFLSYKVDPNTISKNSSGFSDLNFEDKKRLMIEVLDKNMLYIPLSEIEDDTYGLSSLDKNLNKQFFS
jgi:adenine-specific DNA-methyltransferase